MQTILIGYAILFFLLFGMAALISLKERERHAAALFLAIAVGLSALYLAAALWMLPAAAWPGRKPPAWSSVGRMRSGLERWNGLGCAQVRGVFGAAVTPEVGSWGCE